MGPKLSRIPAETVYMHDVRHREDLYANKTTASQQPLSTTATSSDGAPTTANVATATASLLAALRWKKLVRRRGRSRAPAQLVADVDTRQQPPQHQPTNPGGVWAKLIGHLSRKVSGRRSRRRQQRVGGPDQHGAQRHQDGAGRGARVGGGTSAVLPVIRNPVTSVVAYAGGDDVGGPGQPAQKDGVDVNSNVADIVRRITISKRCDVSRDVTDFVVPQASLTAAQSHPLGVSDSQAQRPRKTIQIQASTGELLAGLGEFLRCRCRRLRHFDGAEVGVWLRSVDRALIEHAWQDTPFVGPANLVLVYLLAHDAVDPDIVTVGELRAIVMACLYVAFSYAGCEISYPLKPFISSAGVDEIPSNVISGGPGKKRFWNRCLAIIERSSSEMLRLNREPAYFAELFRELKTYAAATPYYAATTTSSSATGNASMTSSICRTSHDPPAVQPLSNVHQRCHGNEE